MKQSTTPHRPERRFRLGDLEFDEDRWRKLLELAEADRRDPRAYMNIQAELHIDRRWHELARRRAAAAVA